MLFNASESGNTDQRNGACPDVDSRRRLPIVTQKTEETMTTDYKAERREQARKAGKCTMCMKRKARTTKSLLTCGPCSKAAGERRDALVAERRAETTKAERKTRTTTGTRAGTARTSRAATSGRPKARAKA
jgi:hypothetical protein